MLALSVGVIYFVIVGKVEGTWLFIGQHCGERNTESRSGGGEPGLVQDYSPLMYISMFFGWGMGLATNPQYMIRIVAAKDKRRLEKCCCVRLFFWLCSIFALTQIGLGLKIFSRLDTFHDTDDILFMR